MTHSFYAVMGGFTYTLREGSRVYLPDDRNREQLTLRHEALRFVAKYEPSLIPKLTVNAIRDKSKASAFVKIITLFQGKRFRNPGRICRTNGLDAQSDLVQSSVRRKNGAGLVDISPRTHHLRALYLRFVGRSLLAAEATQRSRAEPVGDAQVDTATALAHGHALHPQQLRSQTLRRRPVPQNSQTVP